jgi:hypothetical protein
MECMDYKNGQKEGATLYFGLGFFGLNVMMNLGILVAKSNGGN